MQIETVRTADFSMNYFRFGTGERTMVILPGLSIKSVMDAAPAVAKQYAVFQQEFTVYVFDRREELPDTYSAADMARDTAAAMEALGLADVYLFGASQGGMIAMAIAVEYPHLVKRLALGSTAAVMPQERMSVLGEWIRLAQEGDRVGLYLAFGEAIYPPDVFQKYRGALIMIAHAVTDAELGRFVTLAEGTRGFDVLDRLDGIRCPVLLIGASDDAVIGADAMAQIAERLKDTPGFESYLYDGYGHAAFDTAPDYQERLYRFFMM